MLFWPQEEPTSTSYQPFLLFPCPLPTLAWPAPCPCFFKVPQSQQPFHRCIPSPSLPCKGHISHLEIPESNLWFAHPEVRREGREALPDHAGESPVLSRSGGAKGLRGSGAETLGVPLEGAGTLGVPLEGTQRVGEFCGRNLFGEMD